MKTEPVMDKVEVHRQKILIKCSEHLSTIHVDSTAATIPTK